MGKMPVWEKFLWGFVSMGKSKCYYILEHTQMCQTDCKSEPKLDFRPLNRCFKNPSREKMNNCYYWWTFIFTQH